MNSRKDQLRSADMPLPGSVGSNYLDCWRVTCLRNLWGWLLIWLSVSLRRPHVQETCNVFIHFVNYLFLRRNVQPDFQLISTQHSLSAIEHLESPQRVEPENGQRANCLADPPSSSERTGDNVEITCSFGNFVMTDKSDSLQKEILKITKLTKE